MKIRMCGNCSLKKKICEDKDIAQKLQLPKKKKILHGNYSLKKKKYCTEITASKRKIHDNKDIAWKLEFKKRY